MAEISQVKYSKELQKIIFPDNSFYKHSIQETGIADTVETVERPYQGSIGKGKRGEPVNLPLSVKTAKDGKDSYSTQLVYADPIVVNLPGEFALNYSKRQTKQQQQASVINTTCAEIAATEWGPTLATNILKTTGAGRASNVLATAGGTLANKKAVTKNDMVDVFNLLLRMNVAGVDGKLFGLVTADFYADLLKIAEFTLYQNTGMASKLEKGIIGNIMNIEIMVRSNDQFHTGLMYDNSGTPVKHSLDDSILSTSRPAALFWNDKMTASAEGKMNTSINDKAPGYLGATIIESWTRFGAAHARYDQKGIVALLEENA